MRKNTERKSLSIKTTIVKKSLGSASNVKPPNPKPKSQGKEPKIKTTYKKDQK